MTLHNKLERLSLAKLFQLNLMFAGMAEAYFRVEHLKGASLGLAPPLPANIRLVWNGLSRTNAQAYEKS